MHTHTHLAFIALACCPLAAGEYEEPLLPNRLSVSHHEPNGIGYPDAYSSATGFLTLLQHEATSLFVDLRGHVFSKRAHFFRVHRSAANLGAGFRELLSKRYGIVGANLFYDYRRVGHHALFHQVGAGIECLRRRWDIRANGYLPIGEREHGTHDKESSEPFGLTKREFAMRGADLRIGRILFRDRDFLVHAMLGGYYFKSKLAHPARGGLVRLSSWVNRFFSLGMSASYDSLFGDLYQFDVAFVLPFGSAKAVSHSAYQQRLIEGVSRFEIMVVEEGITKRR